MSEGQKRPYAVVLPIAERIVEALSKYCFRIELAGSLRREKAEVGDIEIVAIPIPLNARLDNTIEAPYLLDEWLRLELSGKKLTVIKNGEKYKQFKFWTRKGHEYKVDLFLQPDPATWGTNFMIRTGSADFSQWMVTPRDKGGAVPLDGAGRPLYYCRDARWWLGNEAMSTPEEEDVFKLLGVEWIAPKERVAGFWHRGEHG